MEGEGEANRTEEGVEPRGGRGAKVVDDEAELGADPPRVFWVPSTSASKWLLPDDASVGRRIGDQKPATRARTNSRALASRTTRPRDANSWHRGREATASGWSAKPASIPLPTHQPRHILVRAFPQAPG